MTKALSIVGIGGTTSPNSSTEQALNIALAEAAALGARTQLFGGEALASLPHYDWNAAKDSTTAQNMIAALREADGIILASPGYHGTISGLVKNALDYCEETAKDERPYWEGLPIGLIVTAYGWQATGSTLATMRSIAHALRGWPTPFGAGIRSASGLFSEGVCTDESVRAQLARVGEQVVSFAARRTVA